MRDFPQFFGGENRYVHQYWTKELRVRLRQQYRVITRNAMSYTGEGKGLSGNVIEKFRYWPCTTYYLWWGNITIQEKLFFFKKNMTNNIKMLINSSTTKIKKLTFVVDRVKNNIRNKFVNFRHHFLIVMQILDEIPNLKTNNIVSSSEFSDIQSFLNIRDDHWLTIPENKNHS